MRQRLRAKREIIPAIAGVVVLGMVALVSVAWSVAPSANVPTTFGSGRALGALTSTAKGG
jgi:hypothetical protein